MAQKKTAYRQILNDPKIMSQVSILMDNINGHNFEGAAKEQKKLADMIPNHPVLDLTDALTDYWKNYPVYAYEDKAAVYRAKLFACNDKSLKNLETDPNSIESTFFVMMTDMMLAKHYSDRGENLTSINFTRKSFGLIKKGFTLKSSYVEFYFTTGLYDFFREAIPELNPVIRPLMWFFPEGSKVEGLKELDIAFTKSTFTRADAAVFLTRIYLYFENRPSKALPYIEVISKEYPGNPHYRIAFAEALLASKRYEDALPLIKQLLQQKEEFYSTGALILKGWYHEAGDKDFVLANKCYVKGLELAKKQKGRMYDNFKGIAYLGLARAWKKSGDQKKAYQYAQLAAKVIAYPDLKTEAKGYTSD